ncbi:hypothetical protein NDU88_000962 [Pleurodeles waltl]|uniref:Uncharacterized protein n=1 Tax=Pleurodeles waltl TaxID=8319 RepID=A0AAV7R5S3_PLEWA|nr:hypothetical protein NDU88_000962 [Pleurodeles waltl]
MAPGRVRRIGARPRPTTPPRRFDWNTPRAPGEHEGAAPRPQYGNITFDIVTGPYLEQSPLGTPHHIRPVLEPGTPGLGLIAADHGWGVGDARAQPAHWHL